MGLYGAMRMDYEDTTIRLTTTTLQEIDKIPEMRQGQDDPRAFKAVLRFALQHLERLFRPPRRIFNPERGLCQT